MIDRKELIEEQLLRKNVRGAIKIVLEQRKLKEKYIRNIVKSLLKEVAIADKIPHASTGINELEKLLKKIIPILQDSYISLTTSEEQRASFSNHIMNAVKNSLLTANTNAEALAEAIEIDVDEDDSPPEFIDIEDDEVEEEEEVPEEEEFATGVEDQGLDKTGRNIAFQTYKQIEQQILDSYGILANEEDRSVFQEYMLINLKLYFEKFEKEMATDVEAPDVEVPEGSEEAVGDDTGEEMGFDDEEEMDFGF